LLILGLGAIGLAQRGDDPAAANPVVGERAPDVTLTLLNGTPLRLADLRGSVVVLNFWASWCRYCPTEMRALQTFSDAAARDGDRVAVVGVGARTDVDADARAFVSRLHLTYPIGRDTATDQPGVGPIERAFGTTTEYPATIFIRPDGIVDRFHLGPLTADQLRQGVDAARTDASS
jgi:cytochrome c biogenesis protein CcmG/thiol:disulfide interchange protein DsbE